MKVFLLSLLLSASSQAAVVYSGLQHISIPTDLNGVFIDIDGTTPMTSFSDFTGADINPFFGGMGIANNPAFQPARTGTGNLDAMLRLNMGDLISSALNYSTGYGGSGDPNEHIGAGANMFQAGSEAFIGFRFVTNSNSGPYYGWMRVKLTLNISGGEVIDWAYDDSGVPILAGVGMVPEPSRVAMLALGLALVSRRQRRVA